MKKETVILLMSLLFLSACHATSTPNDVAGLYTGQEQGSWYKFSSNCSAKLCPAY